MQNARLSFLLYGEGKLMWNEDEAKKLLKKWVKKLRITPGWDVTLVMVREEWRKSGDIKIDCDDRKAVLLLNAHNPSQTNMEVVIVHELMHLKMYPLDQVTEGLIQAHCAEGSPESDFAYGQFFTALEQTVEELTKCFLLRSGKDKELSFGRAMAQKSFDELYKGLKNLE